MNDMEYSFSHYLQSKQTVDDRALNKDVFNALKLEKKLARQGILLFATDEPAVIEGINATTVLVRRVKQSVAEWLRLQIKEKTSSNSIGNRNSHQALSFGTEIDEKAW